MRSASAARDFLVEGNMILVEIELLLLALHFYLLSNMFLEVSIGLWL